jgi:hypothetical protein
MKRQGGLGIAVSNRHGSTAETEALLLYFLRQLAIYG